VSATDASTDTVTPTAEAGGLDMRLEVVGLPVSDIDRAKDFYATKLGWRLDADFDVSEDFRVVQVTPPGSPCSIQFGRGITASAPGSVDHVYLVVSDIVAARDELVGRGVEVSETFHKLPGQDPQPGPDPARGTYQSFARFSDPDGNTWLLQEITTRLPGR
jgi:catechol 2,3-dioxygenase-like lactoylglutathione lyase family enzyme